MAVQLAPINFQWCSDSALEQVAALSHERGTPVHLHLLETFDLPNQDKLVILKDVPPATKKQLDELWLEVKLS